MLSNNIKRGLSVECDGYNKVKKRTLGIEKEEHNHAITNNIANSNLDQNV
jgi:hypothetical protein